MIAACGSSASADCATNGSLCSFRHHHFNELFIIYLAVTIDVRLPDHFIHFFIRELLAKIRHDVAQLCRADKAVPIAIENFEGLDQFFFRAIKDKNSGKSIVPLPSASTSLIISWSSASVGFWPRDRITVPSSLVVIVPSPSLSKRENASLNSAICSSVS